MNDTSHLPSVKKGKTQLLTFNEHQRLVSTGFSKIRINALSRYLIIEPYDEEKKPIMVSFDYKFIQEKNILFIISDNENIANLILVFVNIIICRKVISALTKFKVTLICGDLNTKLMHVEKFVVSALSQTNDKNLKHVLAGLIKFYNEKEKRKLKEILKKNNLDKMLWADLFLTADTVTKSYDDKNTCGIRKLKRRNHERITRSTTKTIIKKPKYELIEFLSKGKMKKRLFIFADENQKFCYDFYWYNHHGCFECNGCRILNHRVRADVYNHKREKEYVGTYFHHICQPQVYKAVIKIHKNKIIKKPKYELLEAESNGKTQKRLIVFFDNERKLCYEYYWSSCNKYYYCLGCIYQKQKKGIRANVYHIGTSQEHVEFFANEHVCEPKEYTSVKMVNAKINIIKKPKYELIEAVTKAKLRKRMILYVDDEKTFCYDYIWKEAESRYQCADCKALNAYVHAILHNSGSSDNEYVELCARKHICKPKECKTLEVLKSNQIIKKPKYQISEGLFNGTMIKRLIVFAGDEMKLCYTYSWDKLHQCFKCNLCLRQNRTIRALLHNPDTLEEYIDLAARDHVCKPRKFQSILPLKTSQIIKKPKYELVETISKQKFVKHLIVFVDEKKKDLCYDYYWENRCSKYRCCGCKRLPGEKQTKAAIHNLNTEEEYVDLLGYEHVCEPQKYQSLIVLKKNVIIKKPKYEVTEVLLNGSMTKRLIVFVDEKKELCYDYSWVNANQCFICSPCHSFNKSIRAKVINEGTDEEYVDLYENKHSCKPKAYQSLSILKTFNVVTKPNFEIQKGPSKNGGAEKQVLYIFDSKNRQMCYKYYYVKDGGKFICGQCKNRNITVTAKLCKNDEGEEYIKLSDAKHICELLPYDFVEEITVDSSKFEVIKKSNGATSIFMFNSDAKDYGYNFVMKIGDRYHCFACHRIEKKHQTIKLCQRKNGGEYYILMKANFKHLCEPKKYEPQKLDKPILHAPNFVFYSTKSQLLTQLLIFTDDEKKKCYDFVFSRRKTFACKGCATLKKSKEYYVCHVREDSDGNEFLELSNIKHVCKPTNYSNFKK